MPRTPANRLAGITPAGLAAETVDAVRTHLGRLALSLDPHSQWSERLPPGTPPESSTLGATIAQLVEYAQRGAPGDWEPPTDVYDAVLSVCSAVYGSPLRTTDDGLGELSVRGTDDAESDLAVALLAAQCRAALLDGAPIWPRDLAALAGCASSSIRSAISRGTIRAREKKREGVRRGASIDHRSARVWLYARVVGDEDAAVIARAERDDSVAVTWMLDDEGPRLVLASGALPIAVLCDKRGWERGPGGWVARAAAR
jgi:hypothetical protein